MATFGSMDDQPGLKEVWRLLDGVYALSMSINERLISLELMDLQSLELGLTDLHALTSDLANDDCPPQFPVVMDWEELDHISI